MTMAPPVTEQLPERETTASQPPSETRVSPRASENVTGGAEHPAPEGAADGSS